MGVKSSRPLSAVELTYGSLVLLGMVPIFVYVLGVYIKWRSYHPIVHREPWPTAIAFATMIFVLIINCLGNVLPSYMSCGTFRVLSSVGIGNALIFNHLRAAFLFYRFFVTKSAFLIANSEVKKTVSPVRLFFLKNRNPIRKACEFLAPFLIFIYIVAATVRVNQANPEAADSAFNSVECVRLFRESLFIEYPIAISVMIIYIFCTIWFWRVSETFGMVKEFFALWFVFIVSGFFLLVFSESVVKGTDRYKDSTWSYTTAITIFFPMTVQFKYSFLDVILQARKHLTGHRILPEATSQIEAPTEPSIAPSPSANSASMGTSKLFDSIINDSKSGKLFETFLEREFAVENYLFLKNISILKQLTDDEACRKEAQHILETFCDNFAPLCVNISGKVREELLQNLKELERSTSDQILEMFSDSEFEIKGLLHDPFLRFLKSQEFRDYVKATPGFSFSPKTSP